MFFKCRSHILKWTTSQKVPERSIRVKFNIKVEIIYSECRNDISPVNLEELKTESDQMNQSRTVTLTPSHESLHKLKMTDVSSSSADVSYYLIIVVVRGQSRVTAGKTTSSRGTERLWSYHRAPPQLPVVTCRRTWCHRTFNLQRATTASVAPGTRTWILIATLHVNTYKYKSIFVIWACSVNVWPSCDTVQTNIWKMF